MASKDVVAKIRLPEGSRIDEGDLWNTSLGGVFVETRKPLKFGMEVGVEFALKGAGAIRCEGYVVWTADGAPDKARGRSGYALRLVNIGIKQMRELAQAVARDFD